MEALLASLVCLIVALIPAVQGQCPNLVAEHNPTLRTQSENDTWFLVPVLKTAVQKALNSNYGPGVVLLADIPSSDKTLFPNGFSEDQHPVLVNAGLTDDTRMSFFQIDGPLLSGTVSVPYARRPRSKPNTVLLAQLNGYISGPHDKEVGGLVPALASTLVEGFPLRLGHFAPTADAWQVNANGVLSNKVAWTIIPNPITGPGIYVEAVDLSFRSRALANTTPKLFKAMLNQPSILSGAYLATNTCQRSQLYFNNDTSIMMPRIGTVTLGPAADGELPQVKGILQAASPDGSGVYEGVEGFSACAQAVGYNPEDCDAASEHVDPTAL